ncbi:uncharacterized protein LOC141713114 isoform X1 [Apium graveolens]|uniref:uncharacterized protein LOC141713114 isoform X1 n=1 Tax=Apium graveolens TaxID=4045 RepID=UPI003D7965C8
MGIPDSTVVFPQSPLGDVCLRNDLTAIHEILKSFGTKMTRVLQLSLKVFEKSPISLRGVRPMSLMEMESLLNSYHLTVYPGLESVYNTAISYREIFSLKS